MAELEIEVVGLESCSRRLSREEIDWLCGLALAAGGVEEGHLALEFVSATEITELNREHRDRNRPTDVLSFPVDEDGEPVGPREIGDIVICPEHTHDLREAVVHGVLHLTGMDHEVDDGEMLALQQQILSWTGP